MMFSAPGMISAMHDVGTYRQVRPLVQPAGGYVHNEQMYPNNHRPSPRVDAFSAMHDVFRAGDDFRDA